ncbi:PEP-CTERM sorting domain-containing protein [Nodosilinea sp. PGN35]|uniref:PEP-CTERM sorting domain-containing protein n=1 Tax=Nodosilinea sp. PGN35 TaxID=3020489 RepID=UPI0023B2A0FF|nr:PEP-CTERM sorting domain-containing protein [Nodosilinea sp. TSF1-S3]MDF0367635.1 PEP-CTERM sorting domain-containing protein [Nodosilinea sp. TSF1-S3]
MTHRSAITAPLLGLALSLASTLAPGLAGASPLPPGLLELTQGNSTYRTDLLRFSDNQSWLVDGIETLFTDLYFLNLSSLAAPQELRLEDLQPLTFSQPSPDRISASFFGGSLTFALDSVLLGGAPGSYRAAREETVTLTNTGSDWLDVSLFKYIDYDLQFDGVLTNNTAFFANNTLTQTDPSGALATLSVDQTPTAVQISPYGSLLAQLYNVPATGLQNTPGPLVDADATAAVQFDRTLAPGESVVFKFLMTVQRQAAAKAVPEPGTAFALGVGAAGLALLRRRR